MADHKATMTNKYPEKKLTDLNCSIGQDGFIKGWNACHDAFMEIINKEPKNKVMTVHEIYELIIKHGKYVSIGDLSYELKLAELIHKELTK